MPDKQQDEPLSGADLRRLIAQQEQQLQQLAYQKHILEQQLEQLQGNLNATWGSIQMLRRLAGVPEDAPIDEPVEENDA